ncbi:MAG TPA: nucleotidyltransferase family protein [Gaiellaceae bacterium]|nr:nucleotidyltransferase family protein [Gaiellaceae bacterium]
MRNAIVMAAGEGRRLRPLTEAVAKPVLPIDGRPVIATLLRDLADAGAEEVTVVVGHLAEQVRRLLGDGGAFAVRIRYVEQPEPLGSADAVLRALRGGAPLPTLVTAADTVFGRGDVARFASAFAASGAAGAIAGRYDPPPAPPHRYGLRIEDGRVTRVLDDDPANRLAGAPLWGLDDGAARFLDPLPGRAPYELASAGQLAIDAGETIAGVVIGKTRDLTRPLDLVMENFHYVGGVT